MGEKSSSRLGQAEPQDLGLGDFAWQFYGRNRNKEAHLFCFCSSIAELCTWGKKEEDWVDYGEQTEDKEKARLSLV